jgi:hypothetical protein
VKVGYVIDTDDIEALVPRPAGIGRFSFGHELVFEFIGHNHVLGHVDSLQSPWSPTPRDPMAEAGSTIDRSPTQEIADFRNEVGRSAKTA